MRFDEGRNLMLDLYRDVFKSLNDHEVRYLVIGGIAVGIHATARATHDLDIVIEPTEENARRLLLALEDARLYTAGLTTIEDILKHEITIFRDYVQVDVQTETPGIDFARAWERRVEVDYGGIQFHAVSRDDLIASKEASARPIDLEDLRALRAGMKADDSEHDENRSTSGNEV